MNGIAVLVSLAAMGVDYGWQPSSSDGQLEYIIQIEPSLLEGLKSGEEIVSEIHPDARGVRRFRIRVGTSQVPRIGHLQNNTTPRSLTTSNPHTFTSGASDQGTFSTLQDDWRSPSAPGSNANVANDFRPDGFLNLPPPPPLLGPDGKSSVLVRPEGDSTGPTTDILPPTVDPPGTSRSGELQLGPPPGSGRAAPSWPTGGITGPSNSRPSSGGVFPPTSDGSSFPTGSDNSVLPRNDDIIVPPPDTHPIRPIPSPSIDSDTPNPIRFGQSGIKPPGSGTAVSHGDSLASSQRNQNTPGGERDLVARITDPDDVASQKPTIDEETAKKLEAKPWKPLVLTSLALFASLAANAYLGWVALGIYRRYRDMVDQLHQAQASLT